jgi:hypothetical protein
MILGEWLAGREPAPPDALRDRIQAALSAAGTNGRADIAERCMAAGEALLADVLRDGCTARGAALDLLTADALVTYAFEAAAESPADVEAIAAAAMERIARIGGVQDGESSV